MTSTALARQSATISTNAARLAMGAIVAYQLLLSALIFLRPDLAPSWHTISEWAIGRYGWIMSGADPARCPWHCGPWQVRLRSRRGRAHTR